MVRRGAALLALPGIVHSWSSFCGSDGWNQVWSDEFSVFDETSWTKDTGKGDSRVRDAQGLAENVYIDNDALVIRSQRDATGNLTSGALQTRGKHSWRGKTRVCVSAKLPGEGGGHGNGIWPAHWMMPDDSSCWPCHGEIDIMEMINGDGTLHGTYHWGKTSGDNNQIGAQKKMPSDWANAWHEYAVEYDGGSYVSFALDGQVYHTTGRATFYDVPYYIILNTAVGGGWPKPPDASTTFPTYHYVDYVRVSQPDNASALV